MERIDGCIDLPEPGATLDRRAFRVHGWACAPTGPAARVDLLLDGTWLGRAGLGRPRPDVARAKPYPNAGLSGFELHVVRPPVRDNGPSRLKAVVTLPDGTSRDLATVPVQFQPRSDPRPVAAGGAAPHPGRLRTRPPGPIRVLWSARGLDQGGSQLRMAELIEHLHRDGGFRSTVLSPVDGPLRPALEASGAAVEIGGQVPFDDAAGYERSVSALGERIDGRFDLVVGFTVTSFPAVEVAGRLGLPSVLRVGEAAPLTTVVGWLFGSLDPEVEARARHAVAGASVVVSNSQAAVETYRTEGYRGRFVVLGTGVDVAAARARTETTDRQHCRRSLGIGPEERLLLCPGSLWPVKGQAVLVAALGLLHRRHPRLSCAFIGLHGHSPYALAIAFFVARNGLTDVVRMLPFDDDLGPWWRSADAVVCPSESEALPAAVLEGMAHGLPALGCRVGDLPLVIEPDVNGWLCDHSDVASMAAGLEAVARSSPDTLRRMGAAAAAVARCYDRAGALDRWVELLGSVAGGTTGSS